MTIRRSDSSLFVGLCILLLFVSSGCARQIGFHIHSEMRAPNLVGQRVAVLPTFSLGKGSGTAIVGTATQERIFASELAGIHFLPPSATLDTYSANPSALTELRALVSNGLPIRRAPEGEPIRILSGNLVGHALLRRELVLFVQHDPNPSNPLAPASIPVALLSGIDADYVLVSTAFPAYRQITNIMAVLGIVPFFWNQDLVDERPRCHFVLYEVATGRRAWEAVVAMRGPATANDPAYDIDLVDPRALTFAVSTFLFTENLDSALLRAFPPAPNQ